MTSFVSQIRSCLDDRGATAVLTALILLVLIGFSAIAVDATGAGFNQRRQNQSAADVGALTAVQFAVTQNLGNGCTGTPEAIARCNGAHEAIEVADATLDDSSLANWSDASRCGTPPGGFTATSVSPCVAFNSNSQRAWVRIPTIDNPTTFARVIGFDSVSTTADAIAGTSYEPPDPILPFLLPGSAAGQNYECLKSGSNPNFGRCEDNPSIGNFGSADFFLYGDADRGWTTKCSGDTNGRLVANIARGIDHPLTTHDTGSGSGVLEEPNCPVYNAGPNMVHSQTGIGANLEQGLLYGGTAYSSSPYPGAIQDPSGYLVRNAGGSTPQARVNNNPIWNYLVDDGNSGTDGAPCDDETILGAPDASKPALMENCIAWAKTNSTVIFTSDLTGSGRFGWVPEMWQNSFSGNPYYLKTFRPVYLDTTWYGCSANQCTIMHTPGIGDTGPTCPVAPLETRITCGTPGATPNNVQAITSWILDASIVPDNAKTPSPGSLNQRSFNLTE